MKNFWNGLKGYKTYIFAAALVVIGVHLNSPDLIAMGCGLAGLRHGLTTEVQKIALAQDPVSTARKELPAVAAEVATETVAETK